MERMKDKKFCIVLILTCSMGFEALANPIDDVVHGPSDRSINFGVMVQNDNYIIYRSAALGNLGTKHLSKYLKKHGLPFPKTIVYMNKQGYAFPMYYAIEEYKLGLSSRYGRFEFFHPFSKVRTYVDGENPYNAEEDIDTDLTLGPIGKRYFKLQDDGIDGGVETVLNILNLVLDPDRQPVLFHCLGGLHRTGMIGMILRFIQDGFWVNGPKTRARGMDLNPAQYEYYKFNPILFRENNIRFVEAFSRDSRFLELKERYQDAMNDRMSPFSTNEIRDFESVVEHDDALVH